MKHVDTYRYEHLSAITKAARGLTPCDLVITNAQIIDVITETIATGEIWVNHGIIVHVERNAAKFGKFQAKTVFDAKNNYVSPGFMDSHVHIESSMLSPYYFGRAIAVHGTTTAFTDPHEICNVAGKNGIKYMYENGRNSPMRIFGLIPSSVPAVPKLESAGAVISGNDIESLAKKYPDYFCGLAEVMNYVELINGSDREEEILNAARKSNLYLQSHYSGIHGNDLSAYLAAGLGGNHEIRSAEDMIEAIKANAWVDICGGSSISNKIKDLLPALKAFPNPSILPITLCTDDVHAADLLDRSHGHINKVIAQIIASGIAPATAIAYATRNTAREYGIDNLGAIKDGNLADLVIFSDFETIEPTAVFVAGKQIAANGETLEDVDPALAYPSFSLAEDLCETMQISKKITPDMLMPIYNARGRNVDAAIINVIAFDEIYTKLKQMNVILEGDAVRLAHHGDLCYIAVINRYGKGNVALGILEGFGLKRGAIATTVSHDSHNLTLIYKDPFAAAKLANRLIACGGGIIATPDGKEYCDVKLPIGGLMSPLSAEELAPQIQAVESLLQEMFDDKSTSLLKIAILTLPVVPEVRVTDRGIVDVTTQEFIPLFVWPN